MVDFNELRITPDGRYLIIDVSVKSDSIYNEITIDKIVIDNQDTFLDNGPSSSALYEATLNEEYRHYRWTLESVELQDKDLENNLFFVYIICKGDIDYSLLNSNCSLPCDAELYTTLGTVMASYPYYEQAMSYLSDLSKTCTIPKDFIDFILRTKAMELAVKTGNYTEAIKYYNKFFKDGGMYSDWKGGCGCGTS